LILTMISTGRWSVEASLETVTIMSVSPATYTWSRHPWRWERPSPGEGSAAVAVAVATAVAAAVAVIDKEQVVEGNGAVAESSKRLYDLHLDAVGMYM
jgi:hypothetical protein